MLSRTADHLFWMSRYTERAENTARLLDVNHQASLLPESATVAQSGWEGLLRITELQCSYQSRYSRVSARDVLHFMVRDEDNPSSIVSCLRAVLENARAVRGALTDELWETQKQTWGELTGLLNGSAFEQDPSRFFEWVKIRSHLSRGVAIGTMLQDEAFYFYRMGTFLERADNTARLLDVKFRAAESNHFAVAQDLGRDGDFHHWSVILRSVSALEAYRKVYRSEITPERVAELLILRADMPRSLLASMNELVGILRQLDSSVLLETERRAGKLRADLQYSRIDEILSSGLHAFLTQFLDRVNELGARINHDFLMPAAA